MSLRLVEVPPQGFGYIIDRTGCHLSANARGVAAVDDAGRIWGMVAYDGWTDNAAMAHMAVETPIAWRILRGPAFELPFEKWGRRVLIGVIAADNAKSLKLVRKFGFVETHRIKDGRSVGVDLVIVEMRKEHCRWLTPTRRAA